MNIFFQNSKFVLLLLQTVYLKNHHLLFFDKITVDKITITNTMAVAKKEKHGMTLRTKETHSIRQRKVKKILVVLILPQERI